MVSEKIEKMTKEELLQIVELYAKNWLAMDGVWFQSVEKKHGMDTAMLHDCEIWRTFTRLEAEKIKKFLNLPENGGIEGLKDALMLRLYANINKDEITIEGNTLIYSTLECRVQHAREAKGMELHPCKSVGIIEYTGFAQTIDKRFKCECLSCYPDDVDKTCHCKWKFTLVTETEDK